MVSIQEAVLGKVRKQALFSGIPAYIQQSSQEVFVATKWPPVTLHHTGQPQKRPEKGVPEKGGKDAGKDNVRYSYRLHPLKFGFQGPAARILLLGTVPSGRHGRLCTR